MASDGKTPIGQHKVSVALIFALLMILLNNGAEANPDDAKRTHLPLPLRFRNPRGAGLSHQGERTSNAVPGEQEAVPEDHGDKTMPKFSYLDPSHIRDPRGVALSRPAVTENLDHAHANEMETEVQFTHLPRLHNPRGVNAVKQIQKGMIKESDSQAGEEGKRFPSWGGR